ncbi:MAG: PLP-dependent transferase [Acidobacteria bacterium]|nr:PLP-dependent transferase [Acidobacteriota bacterium]
MDWRSKLLHAAPAPVGFESLAPATYRGSTTVLPDLPATANATWRQPYSYGLYGTPTVLDLAQRIADLCGGSHTFIVPSGQAAIALVSLALLRPGNHVLLPENIYGTSADLAQQYLIPMGVEADFYDAMQPLAAHIRGNTRLIWFEAPGSITMETPDLRAQMAEVQSANAVRSEKIVTAIDDTYSSGVLLRPFDLDIDIAVQALTKYIGGHSDLLLGSVTIGAKNDAIYEALGNTHRILGLNASPDDASLALRGLQTLAVRLEALEKSTLQIAKWCANHPAIETVLHPAFPTCSGHESFKTLFTGSASIFSFVLKREFLEAGLSREAAASEVANAKVAEVISRLKLFKLGYSWGGTTSVVMAYPDTPRIQQKYGPGLIRLGIGLEDPADLIADLAQALS